MTRCLACLALLGLAAAGPSACGGKKASPGRATPGAGTPSADSPRPSSAPPLAPKVAWRTPYAGRLRTLAVVGEVVVVASRQRGDRSSARRLAGFSTKDGRLLWQRPLRLRYFERNAPWTTSHAVVGGVLAVAKSADRVEGLDPRTGAKLWQHRSIGGVVAAGDAFALARREEVLLVTPREGKVLRRQSLGDVASGAPGNGLMDELKPGTRLAAVPGGILLSRRHGAALQALEVGTLKARWQLFPAEALPTRPDRFAVGPRTVLVPVLRPRRVEQTQLRVWSATGDTGASGAPQWTVTVPGRVSAKRLWVTPTQVLGLSRTTNRQTMLWRVDRAKGTLVDARPFPMPHFCYLGPGVLVCQRGKEVSAHELETLSRRWRYVPPAGQTIRSVRRAGRLLVMEVGAGLLVKRLTDGGTVLETPRRHGKHPYRVVSALGEAGGRLVVAVRHLEGTPWGDRLLLLGLELATGKTAFEHRLGRFPRPNPLRPGAVAEDEKLPGSLPLLWAAPGAGREARVLSLFDQTFQVLDAASGRPVFTRGIPGDAGQPARVLREDGRVAVLQRGKSLFALSLADHRVLWQASLWKVRLELAAWHRAFVSRKGRRGRVLELAPPRAPDPVAPGRALVERLGCDLRGATPSRWYCQSQTHLLVLDPRGGRILERLPVASNVLEDGGLVVSTHPDRVKGAVPSAWLGVSATTGKERWRLEEPDEKGAAAAAALPAPLEREQVRPSRWAAAAAGLFLVTDAAGACLHGVEQDSGRRLMRACPGPLGGPPIAYAARLLLTAHPPAGGSGAPLGGQALFAVDPGTGASKVLLSPEGGKSLVLGAAPVVGDRLYLTVRPVKGVYQKNEVLGLTLR